jgi:hypothetical protein
MEVDTQTNDKTYNLTVKGQNDRNIEIHIASKLTVGDLLQRIDDLTKDKESWTHYTVGNTRLILNGASMENALITDKYNMTTTLDEIIGLTDGSVLTLAQGQPNRNRSLHANVDSPAYSNLAQFKTLVRNVKACNNHAQRDQEPNSRPRYDQPENIESLPPQPMVRNLGEAAEEFSNVLLKLSHILGDLGENLKSDATSTDRNSVEYQRSRRQIQNTMDALRYAGPACTALSKFVVPIAQPAPRPLRIVQRR